MDLMGTVHDKIFEKCSYLVKKGKRVSFSWIPSHVGILGKEAADKVGKEGLNFPVVDL